MPVREASSVKGEAVSGIEHPSSLPVGNAGSPALNAVSPFVEMGAYAEHFDKLRDAAHPVETPYYVGIWHLPWSQSRQLFVLNRCFNQRVMMRLH